MPTNFFILAALTSTFGFIIWFNLTAASWLPRDIHLPVETRRSYIRSILFRRWLGFLIYGLIPFMLIVWGKVLGEKNLADLGILFTWNSRVFLWLVILLPVAFVLLWKSAGKPFNLASFPEMRIRRWTPKICLSSALSWIAYIIGLEFCYRGMLLHSLRMMLSDDGMAVLVATGIYALSQYFKRNAVAWLAIPYSVAVCLLTIDTGSLLPVIILHTFQVLVHEGLSIGRHPEMNWDFTTVTGSRKTR